MQWTDLITFKVKCELLEIKPPASILKAAALLEVAEAQMSTPSVSLLDFSDEDVRAYVVDRSIRSHDGGRSWDGPTEGLQPGFRKLTEGLVAEIQAEILPDLERIAIELQPRFDEVAAPLNVGAQTYAFTLRTPEAAVIDMPFEAIEAFRAIKPALVAIEPLARLRTAISSTFGLSPTPAELVSYFGTKGQLVEGDPGDHLDFTVCFAAADSWSTDGAFYVEGKPRGAIDWLAMAAGGLHLNTPAEVDEKVAHRYQQNLALPLAPTVREPSEGERAGYTYIPAE